ncbi:MAG: hypothetical protein COB07_05850 [Sulfurovum sp.]|nr:MAG: hypothetical protein COB07_05850 [Sulfurovum sp.]
MKNILLSIIVAATTLSAEDEISKLPNILFTSSYTATSAATHKEREDRAFIGYCLHLLYLQTDNMDLKILGVDYDIQIAAKDVAPANATEADVAEVIKVSCKRALENPANFKETLFDAIEKYKTAGK